MATHYVSTANEWDTISGFLSGDSIVLTTDITFDAAVVPVNYDIGGVRWMVMATR